jgi:plastocyanin
MNRVVTAAGLAAVALVAFHAVAAPAATKKKPKPKVVRVEISSDFYDPEKITIHRGQRIKWTWTPGFELHDVYVRKGPEKFHSPTQSAGVYARTFAKPGTFRLYCTQHEMDMTLVVRK